MKPLLHLGFLITNGSPLSFNVKLIDSTERKRSHIILIDFILITPVVLAHFTVLYIIQDTAEQLLGGSLATFGSYKLTGLNTV